MPVLWNFNVLVTLLYDYFWVSGDANELTPWPFSFVPRDEVTGWGRV